MFVIKMTKGQYKELTEMWRKFHPSTSDKDAVGRAKAEDEYWQRYSDITQIPVEDLRRLKRNCEVQIISASEYNRLGFIVEDASMEEAGNCILDRAK